MLNCISVVCTYLMKGLKSVQYCLFSQDQTVSWTYVRNIDGAAWRCMSKRPEAWPNSWFLFYDNAVGH